jgi:hypothetical protein
VNIALTQTARPPFKAPSCIPVLARLVPIGNGSLALKTKVTEADLDTWIAPQEASEILGVSLTSVYALLDNRYLVSQRPLPRKIRINLGSVLAYKRAAADPAFWSTPSTRAKYVEGVRNVNQSAFHGAPKGAYDITLVNGTLIAKPKPDATPTDAWLTPKKAAEFLGIKTRTLYQLLDDSEPYLVSKRPLKRKIMVSRKSVLDYKRAVANPAFWRTPSLRAEYVEGVRDATAALSLLQQVAWAAAKCGK